MFGVSSVVISHWWPLGWGLAAVLVWRFWPTLQAQKVLFLPFFARWNHWAQRLQVGQGATSPWPKRWFVLGFVCLLAAAIRPMGLLAPDAQWQSGRSWWLAIDLSASMLKTDFMHQGQEVTRWELLKEALQGWIPTRQGDRIGVIGFGGEAFVVHPPSRDVQFVADQLSVLRVGMAGGQTAMGEALGLAVLAKARWPVASDQWTLLVVSDGANTDALDPLQMAALARAQGMTIHTLGVGPLTEEERLARQGVWHGNRAPEPTEGLDETMLKQLAQMGGGGYVRLSAGDSQARLAAWMNDLVAVQTPGLQERPQVDFAPYLLLFVWLAWGLAGLLVWRAQIGEARE